jgi:hypothetical protein
VVALRAACVAHGESDAFNAFLRTRVKAPYGRGRHGAAWELVVAANCTLVSDTEDSGVSDVTAAQAAAFLLADDAPSAAQSQAAPAAGDGESAIDLRILGSDDIVRSIFVFLKAYSLNYFVFEQQLFSFFLVFFFLRSRQRRRHV